MSKKIKLFLKILLAIFLILLGVLGLILPILHGLGFLIAGIIILSFEFPQIDKYVSRHIDKNIHVKKMYEKVHKFLRKYF
jgi:uncharacterized protein YqgC (DUF456 family)